MTLKIAIQNEMLCGSVFFSLLKKFIYKLEDLCADAGVCSVANIELGETKDSGRLLKAARFDIKMNDGQVIHIATAAKTMDDAISNAFDQCARQLSTLVENRV